jgi:hypothetical protein
MCYQCVSLYVKGICVAISLINSYVCILQLLYIHVSATICNKLAGVKLQSERDRRMEARLQRKRERWLKVSFLVDEGGHQNQRAENNKYRYQIHIESSVDCIVQD